MLDAPSYDGFPKTECYDCGKFVEKARLCNLKNTLHCYSCHRNAIAVIPENVIRKGDFSCYKVCEKCSYNLDFFIVQPSYVIEDFFPNSKVERGIKLIKILRQQLACLKEYVNTCSRAEKLTLPKDHLTLSLPIFSIEDLIKIEKGVLVQEMRASIQEHIAHTLTCPICQMKGFIFVNSVILLRFCIHFRSDWLFSAADVEDIFIAIATVRRLVQNV